jgi:prophage regulatory protein
MMDRQNSLPATKLVTAPALLRLSEVLARTKMSRSETYRRIALGTHPAPVKLGTGSRWVESEVSRFINDLIAERDAKAVRA